MPGTTRGRRNNSGRDKNNKSNKRAASGEGGGANKKRRTTDRPEDQDMDDAEFAPGHNINNSNTCAANNGTTMGADTLAPTTGAAPTVAPTTGAAPTVAPTTGTAPTVAPLTSVAGPMVPIMPATILSHPNGDFNALLNTNVPQLRENYYQLSILALQTLDHIRQLKGEVDAASDEVESVTQRLNRLQIKYDELLEEHQRRT